MKNPIQCQSKNISLKTLLTYCFTFKFYINEKLKYKKIIKHCIKYEYDGTIKKSSYVIFLYIYFQTNKDIIIYEQGKKA